MAQHVLVIGGGFSGTMLAVNLLRHSDAAVTLVERGEEPGRGLAYGPAHPSHLLNVRAANMSALPDDPDHFTRWLQERGHADPAPAFAPRRLYGAYVQDVLDGARVSAGARLQIVCGEVDDLRETGSGVAAWLAGGRVIEADVAALALGNAPPQAPPGLDPDPLPPGRFVGDPWSSGATAGLAGGDSVLLIGTGLTMIDVALRLDEEGFTGPILAISRRGLLPRAHASGPPPVPRSAPPEPIASRLLREVRSRAEQAGWRAAVDELRPVTQRLWASADPVRRRRFLRHLRPWWDVHRHRIAPEIHARIDTMIGRGQLQVAAGKLERVEAGAQDLEVTWRPRGSDTAERSSVSRIINCTGPEANLRATADPLLHRLLGRGLIRPDPLGIGIDVDADSRVIARDGAPALRLFALGPPTRGAFWEIVAVPDIRQQAWRVARLISNQAP